MLSRRPARIAAAALLLAPALAGAAWATTGTPPLAMRVAPTAVARLGIEVTNAAPSRSRRTSRSPRARA